MLDRKNTSPFVPLWPVFGSAANGTSSSSIISRLSAPSSFGRFANGTASGSMVTVVVPGPPEEDPPLSRGPEELPPPPPPLLPPPVVLESMAIGSVSSSPVTLPSGFFGFSVFAVAVALFVKLVLPFLYAAFLKTTNV